ncbi:MAG: VWA domain-containing protein [Candidatus Binataceae bacterium]
MTPIRLRILRLIADLRAAGVRISVAETLDAMRAIAAAGFDRVRMREALAATLIKDEADRPLFDKTFVRLFGHSKIAAPNRAKNGAGVRLSSAGHSRISPGAQMGANPEPEPQPGMTPRTISDREAEDTRDNQPVTAEAGAQSGEFGRREKSVSIAAGESGPGIDASRQARLRTIETVPFTRYSELDYETARDTFALLLRRFRIRLGRRLRTARRGRVDFRRTIRAAIQHGGALIDLRLRARRPRRLDLLLLADVSGSVHYAAALILELAAGVRENFHRVKSFVFIDRLAEADFVDGHLTMTPPLDLHARSDFGRVLAEVWRRRDEMLGPATLIVIMGDARNNRRPARADLLADMAQRCRAIYWLNPEPPGRWGTGDSAMNQYARHVDVVIAAETLRNLEAALLKVA